MKSLEEWNKDRAAKIEARDTYPKNNGIACPKCGAELQDTDAGILLSYPAQKRVKCSKCDYVGYRIV